MIPLAHGARHSTGVTLLRADALSIADQIAWAELSQSAAADSIYAADWFVRPILRHFDVDGANQLCIVHGKDGAWNGVAILAPHRRFGRIGARHMRSLANANRFMGVPLVRPGCEADFWAALLCHVDARRDDFALYLRAMPTDHRVTRALDALCHATRRARHIVASHRRAAIDSSLSGEAYWTANLSKNRRNRLAALERQLARDHGPIRVERAQSHADMARWTSDFLMLEASGWKGRGASALAAAHDSRQLFESVVASAFAEGQIVCLSLYAGDNLVAMTSYFVGAARHYYGFKTAFDEDYARFAPGLILLRHLMACMDGKAHVRFDSCATPHDQTLCHMWREQREICDIAIARSGWRGRARFAYILSLGHIWHRLKSLGR